MTSITSFLNAVETRLSEQSRPLAPAVTESCKLIGQALVIPAESAMHETSRILRSPYGRKFVENTLAQAVRHQPRLDAELTYLTARMQNPYPPMLSAAIAARETAPPRRRPSALFFVTLLLSGGMLGFGLTKLVEAAAGAC